MFLNKGENSTYLFEFYTLLNNNFLMGEPFMSLRQLQAEIFALTN